MPPASSNPKESPARKFADLFASRDAKRLVAIGALVTYGLLFVVLNSHNVSISFVFFSTHVPVLVALLVAGGIGVGAGWMLANRQSGRQTRFKPR